MNVTRRGSLSLAHAGLIFEQPYGLLSTPEA